MRKTLLAFFLVCVAVVAGHAQLLSTDIAFPTDASTIVVTVDANKGNKGLLNHTASDVYVHTGVITNLSTGPTNWRYVKFNQKTLLSGCTLHFGISRGIYTRWESN